MQAKQAREKELNNNNSGLFVNLDNDSSDDKNESDGTVLSMPESEQAIQLSEKQEDATTKVAKV